MCIRDRVNALPEVEDIIGNAEDGSDTELTEQQITDIAAAWSAYSDLSEAQKESMQGTEEYSKLEALHTCLLYTSRESRTSGGSTL